MAYWDTSCLVKLYAPEADSAVFKAHVVNGATVVTCEIARMELWATLCRKEAEGGLDARGARKALEAYDADVAAGQIVVETINAAVTAEYETIIEKFHGQIPALPLRTLDAIHLASAKVSGESEVIATDKRLRDAALVLGFSVYPPT
jgi:predicted nucleic acid-binding protein